MQAQTEVKDDKASTPRGSARERADRGFQLQASIPPHLPHWWILFWLTSGTCRCAAVHRRTESHSIGTITSHWKHMNRVASVRSGPVSIIYDHNKKWYFTDKHHFNRVCTSGNWSFLQMKNRPGVVKRGPGLFLYADQDFYIWMPWRRRWYSSPSSVLPYAFIHPSACFLTRLFVWMAKMFRNSSQFLVNNNQKRTTDSTRMPIVFLMKIL